MRSNDVAGAVCIGVTLEELPRVLSLAETHRHIFASVGVHPETTDIKEPTVAELVRLAQHPKVVAIGETGLDYYWHKDAPEWQRERFRVHIRAARATGKPLVIHTRSSADERVVELRLTEKGRSLQQQAERFPACILEASGQTLEQINALRDQIVALRDQLQKSL